MKRSQTQPFWKRIFCLCSPSEPQEDLHVLTVEPPINEAIKHKMSRVSSKPEKSLRITKSNLSMQLDQINDKSRVDLQFVPNSSGNMCFLVYSTTYSITYFESDYRIDPKNIFESYSSVTEYDVLDRSIAPEQVCKYIAKRVTCNGPCIVLEVNSAYNQHSIQFAKLGANVIAVNKNKKQILKGQTNAKAYQVEIDQIQMDFQKAVNIHFKADIVFLNLTGYRKKDNQEIYSILKRALKISDSVVILLKQSDEDSREIQKMVKLLIEILSIIHSQGLDLIKHFSFQEETVEINDIHEYTIIHFGYTSRLALQDELGAISKSLLMKTQIYSGYFLHEKLMINILSYIISQVGKSRLMQLFTQTLAQDKDDLIGLFFIALRNNNLLTKQQFLQMYTDSMLQQVIESEKSPIHHPQSQKLQSQGESVDLNKMVSYDIDPSFSKTNPYCDYSAMEQSKYSNADK